jgi:hypothetical protein
MDLLMPISLTEMKKKKPENLDWDITRVMKFSIQNGTVGVAHSKMKVEYERIKKLSDNRLGKGGVTRDLANMPPWRQLAEAWQQGAAYVCAFWKCHPTMTKDEAFREATTLAAESYKSIKCGKKMIEDVMDQRRLKLTCDAIENVMMTSVQVPNPKWVNSTKKEHWGTRPTHTNFRKCPTDVHEMSACDAIHDFFNARRLPHNQAEPMASLRDWAKNGDRSDIHPDDVPRFTSGVLNAWKLLLTNEESKSPPFKKPSKPKQMDLSKGFPKDGHFEYIGPDGQFHSEGHLNRYLKKAGVFGLIRKSQIYKANRSKTYRPTDTRSTTGEFFKPVLSFLDVYSYHKPVPARTKKQKKTHPTTNCQCSRCQIAATDTEEEEEEEYETPVVSKIVHRWKLPEAQGSCIGGKSFQNQAPKPI